MDDGQASLVSLHALSPKLKSLHLSYGYIPPWEVFDLISSSPSLENLSLRSAGHGEPYLPDIPSASTKLTGFLSLAMDFGIQFCICGLLAFPGGLRFSEIFVEFYIGDTESINDLVSACCDTLESFGLSYDLPSAFISISATRWLAKRPLTATYSPGASEAPVVVDLSKATKLKTVKFHSRRSRVWWITDMLQTVKSQNLKQITIRQGQIPEVGGTVLLEWQELDHLLVQFWMLHSIRPKLVGGVSGLRDFASTFLPELTGRGLLDVA